jgi:predicted ester cyclase
VAILTGATINNAAQVRRIFEEGMNQNKPEVFNELLTADYVNHNMPTPVPGPEGMKLVVEMFKNAFPDFRVDLEDVISEGNLVSSRGYFTGTHQADFQGIAPTGKSIKVSYIDIWRVENGKLVENWVNLDMMGMMQQLGVAPA